jgi:hypothetical protein
MSLARERVGSGRALRLQLITTWCWPFLSILSEQRIHLRPTPFKSAKAPLKG